ncbi:conjugal transfer protein TraF [Helicobacter himalayensis]|uniref:conjugal transfer protein TraF n=1 Tax=Helicobacter himalayensis TaxID=1591088 RepID=UPI00082EA38E|nr:conjugal transfer protein TraF [Helicobacter himalayensis]
MKKNTTKNALILMLCAGLSSINALEFGSMGQVSTSIGGAGVALKQSAWGVYYNPALLAADRRSKVGYSFGAQFREQNLLEALTIDYKELSRIASTLDEKLLGKTSAKGAIANGAISYKPSTGTSVSVDGILGNVLGDMLGIGHNGTLDKQTIEKFAKDLGCTSCSSKSSVEEVAKELEKEAKQNTGMIGKNLKDKLIDAADKNGAPPLLTEMIKSIDPKDIAGLVSGALDGKSPKMEDILSRVGKITLPRGADSDVDRLVDSFNVLNNTLQSNELILNSQNGIVLQIGGKARTKKIESDGIGELSVQEIDSGRGAVAIAILPQVFVGASANIDPTHSKLIVEAGGKYIEATITGGGVDLSILMDANNNTAKQQFENSSILSPNAKHQINATSLALIEVPVGYGHTLFSRIGDIHIGGAVKFMQAFGYRLDQTLNFDKPKINTPKTGDMISQQTFALDLGALYTPFFAKKLNLGLVIKNLNAPHIKMNTGSDIILNRQIRTGVSYELLDFLTIAADYDVLPNNTLSVVNKQSQMLGGGIIADFKYVDFRLGAMKDMKSKAGEGAILTGGVNAFGFLDIAFQYGLGENVTLYGFNVSNYMAFKVGGQFSW